MENTNEPQKNLSKSGEPPKPRTAGNRIIKIIAYFISLISILVIIICCQILYFRPDCRFIDWLSDLTDAVGIPFRQTAYSRFSDAEMAQMGYTQKEHFVCLEQKNHLRHRCYLPHFINNQYEKYQAKQRGEVFYGDVKSCKDIEIQGDGEKK